MKNMFVNKEDIRCLIHTLVLNESIRYKYTIDSEFITFEYLLDVFEEDRIIIGKFKNDSDISEIEIINKNYLTLFTNILNYVSGLY